MQFFHRTLFISFVFPAFSLLAQSNTEFQVDVPTQKKPWSHLNFQNDPENFQFAIVADRTGGMRPGVLPKALQRLNSLHPEFVITVGDLIVGNRKTSNEAEVHEMWDEVEEFVDLLDMPFFYLAGNHDNGSPLLSKVWKERFGVERYHFIYKNVLFLCLNAQDTQQFPAFIKEEQQQWVIQVLKDHPDVRWTFVFLHQPVWMYEDGVEIAENNRTLPARSTGWPAIEEALQGRPHTAFAGHIHQYIKYPQGDPKTNYYTLATTGGGSRLRGAHFGEFDHAMWVTMTDDGPKIANLLIDGILPENVNTEEAEKFRGLISLKGGFENGGLEVPMTVNLELSFTNVFGRILSGHGHWEIPVLSGWKADMQGIDTSLETGETLTQKFTLSYAGAPRKINPVPVFHLHLRDEKGENFVAEQRLPVDFKAFYDKYKITAPPDSLQKKKPVPASGRKKK